MTRKLLFSINELAAAPSTKATATIHLFAVMVKKQQVGRSARRVSISACRQVNAAAAFVSTAFVYGTFI